MVQNWPFAFKQWFAFAQDFTSPWILLIWRFFSKFLRSNTLWYSRRGMISSRVLSKCTNLRSQNTLIRTSIRLFFRSYTNIYSSNELNEYLWLTQCILYESPLFFSECECISRERVGSSIDYRYWFLLHHKIVPSEVGIDRQCTYFFSKCKNSILIPNVRWLLLFRIHLVQ